jgi:hypothetical protein
VRFLALIHNNAAAWQQLPRAEREQYVRDAEQLLEGIAETGELVGRAVVLADAENAKIVRVRTGLPAITDGPFAESKEQFAGYYMLECESMERAIEIVSGDPSVRYFAVEIRPIMQMSGDDM